MLVAPHALCLAVGLHQRDRVRVATGQPQVGERLRVHWEKAAGSAVLGCHIGDGGAVSQRQLVQPTAMEFHKLAHHTMCPQHLYYLQHEVGGGDALAHGCP